MTATRLWQFSGESGDVDNEVDTHVGLPAVTTVEAYTGSRCIRVIGTGQFGKNFSGVEYARGGFQFRHDGFAPEDTDTKIFHVFGFYNPGLVIDALGIYANGNITATGVGSSYRHRIGQSQRWREIGWQFKKISDFLSNLEVYIDGILLYHGTTSQTDLTQIRFGGKTGTTGGWNAVYVDDAWADELTSDEPFACPPSRRFWPSVINGDGADTAWTASTGTRFSCVDEIPFSDTDYISVAASDQRNSFDTADLTIDEDLAVVQSAIVFARAKMESGAGDINLYSFISPDTEDKSDQELSSSYDFKSNQFFAAPDASAWTKAKFNSAQLGVRSRSLA